ncbi:MAG: hypothetical protein UU08_C0003G0043 [Candidatus Uhrbacteria bacterium GW2011_GWE2_40_58]|nr:MAG: hypothetical protein UT94_C0004G0043 [Candidatus Uhrbacteria bacterium GW2011_GWF2_40_263]KKR68120.1 MAG: hypothetical protein UU08_C0003G0043 [Candidatus Uhrbacteria bacterium GW2011_GWE2_40_58]OGL96626.1 MAG: hypothetical protein A2332_03295 [Candidatus Uhrbacteria bacterium RIFOXYB2_FULL_41_18]HBK34422.1 hypothetical protein [Candidatus Uhrbacteria bacterium]HCB55749.1 hypothetical protein [Candidatus Uhrbacteria bacterium]
MPTFVSDLIDAPFWQQPIDTILFTLLLWFGWIPIALVLGWGLTQLWLDHRQGLYIKKLKYVLLAINVPSVTEQSPKAVENLFSGIYGAKSSIIWKDKWIGGKLLPVFSLEIASTEGYIQFYIRTEEKFRDLIEAAIYAHYPDAEISEATDYTNILPITFPNETHEMWGVEFILKAADYLPLRTHVDFEDRITQEIKDPLAQILEQMAKMEPGEHLWSQILIKPEGNDWKDAGQKYIEKMYGIDAKKKGSMLESLFKGVMEIPSGVIEQLSGVSLNAALFGSEEMKKDDDIWRAFKITNAEKEKVEAVLRKIGKVGFSTKMRVVYVASKDRFAIWKRAPIVKGLYHQFSHLNMNGFGLYVPSIPRDDYFWQVWVRSKKQEILSVAFKDRSFGTGATPFTLNVEEIASLWHFPPITIKAPLVQKIEAKRAEPPVGLPMALFGEGNDLPTQAPPGYRQQKFMTEVAEELQREIVRRGLPVDETEAEESIEMVLPEVPLFKPTRTKEKRSLEVKDYDIARIDVESPSISFPTDVPKSSSPTDQEKRSSSEDVPPDLPI